MFIKYLINEPSVDLAGVFYDICSLFLMPKLCTEANNVDLSYTHM